MLPSLEKPEKLKDKAFANWIIGDNKMMIIKKLAIFGIEAAYKNFKVTYKNSDKYKVFIRFGGNVVKFVHAAIQKTRKLPGSASMQILFRNKNYINK